MTKRSIDEIFSSFKDQKILIIGDIMIDSYVWGNVERISPEAPVPVVQVRKKEKRLGGAGNVAKNILSMGAKPLLCSVIGDDMEGRYMIELMQERGIPSDGIIPSKSRITTVKERFISGSQHILRVDEEQVHDLNPSEKHEMKKRIGELLPGCNAVIFEDYDKGVLGKEIIRYTIQLANKLKIPTVVDPKRKNFSHYKQATLFKPNLKEIRDGLKIDLGRDDMEGLKKAVKLLKEKLEVKNVLVTLSEKGVYFSANDNDHLVPAHVRTISDVSGAGDTVVSIAALCVSLHLSPEFTASLSNLGGGLVCEYSGVVAIDRERLRKEAKANGLESL
jgi:D-glycero-beta-D-manno-heptose-7-phosphate kinase